jgi:hypothetical protein
VKTLSISALAIALTLVSCGQRDTAAGPAAVALAAQYCARDFKPWFSVIDACGIEVRNGKRGASCATLDQVNALLMKRERDSGFKECGSPNMRDMAQISGKK